MLAMGVIANGLQGVCGVPVTVLLTMCISMILTAKRAGFWGTVLIVNGLEWMRLWDLASRIGLVIPLLENPIYVYNMTFCSLA